MGQVLSESQTEFKLKIPDEWELAPRLSAETRLSRRFGRPTGLHDGQAVYLQVDTLDSQEPSQEPVLFLNDQMLEPQELPGLSGKVSRIESLLLNSNMLVLIYPTGLPEEGESVFVAIQIEEAF